MSVQSCAAGIRQKSPAAQFFIQDSALLFGGRPTLLALGKLAFAGTSLDALLTTCPKARGLTTRCSPLRASRLLLASRGLLLRGFPLSGGLLLGDPTLLRADFALSRRLLHRLLFGGNLLLDRRSGGAACNNGLGDANSVCSPRSSGTKSALAWSQLTFGLGCSALSLPRFLARGFFLGSHVSSFRLHKSVAYGCRLYQKDNSKVFCKKSVFCWRFTVYPLPIDRKRPPKTYSLPISLYLFMTFIT